MYFYCHHKNSHHPPLHPNVKFRSSLTISSRIITKYLKSKTLNFSKVKSKKKNPISGSLIITTELFMYFCMGVIMIVNKLELHNSLSAFSRNITQVSKYVSQY